MRRYALLALALVLTTASGGNARAVTIEWVTVGDPGNAADTTGYGAVTDTYRISKYETTNAQYAEFLNAVAATDTNALYNTAMGSGYGGISRSGSSGSYSYSVIAGRESMPVNYVSFYDALRFANWLHNGQPTGAQDATTTEDGAYTITPAGIAANSITRNAGATIFLTGEDEWYKAAYYDAMSTSYFDYPAGSDVQTTCAGAGATANTANCETAVGDLTDIGSYTGSTSPNGTFDQGGNVSEWNEAIMGSTRGLRGGGFNAFPFMLAMSARFIIDEPTLEWGNMGFRVASPVPALPVPSLSLLGIAMLMSLLGLAGYRRLHA